MISCDEAAIINNKAQYKEAAFMDRIKLRLHLILCRTCVTFSKQNAQLTSLCNKAHLQGLTTSDKEEMKVELQKRAT